MTRNIVLDLMKVCLAFMVVGLHAGFLSDINELWSFLTVNGIFRIAVPFFFLVNGYYFQPISSISSLKVWMKRIIKLYTFWLIFYAYFWCRPSALSVEEIISLLKTIFVGYHHLWYLPATLGAGLLVYLIRDRLSLIWTLLLLTFFSGVGIQYAGNYHISDSITVNEILNTPFASRNFLLFGFPFFSLGFIIRTYKAEDRISKSTIFLIIASGFILLFLESLYNFSNPLNDGGFDIYLSLLIICPAIFISCIQYQCPTRNKHLSLYSSSIYFIHPFALVIIYKTIDLGNTINSLTAIILSLLLTIILIPLNKKLRFIL
ncbi:acyltransferase [Vibrio parahaemolyticus]|nr:acyltransferase [Vibrio parahaemolyticus]